MNSASRGRQPQRALEVVEEPAPGVRAGEHEARVVVEQPLDRAASFSGDESSSLITQTQSSSRLRPDRVELALEQVERAARRWPCRSRSSGGSPRARPRLADWPARAGSSSIEPDRRAARSHDRPEGRAAARARSCAARSAAGSGRIAQKPLRKPLGPRLAARSGRGIEWAIAGVAWPPRGELQATRARAPSALSRRPRRRAGSTVGDQPPRKRGVDRVSQSVSGFAAVMPMRSPAAAQASDGPSRAVPYACTHCARGSDSVDSAS